jgi:KipI family sensor histidine kinase inhibitor
MLARVSSWVWSGERALLRRFDGPIVDANAAARAALAEMRARGFIEVADLIPGARTLLVELRPGSEPSDTLLRVLEKGPPASSQSEGRHHELVVRYEGEDLAAVASIHGLSPDDVISLHSGADYTVGFIGFSPGFPYLFGLPEQLATPRLPAPRTKVPAGSVAIGGEYTGVYPAATAGGWRLIGSTDATLFDLARDEPAVLAPGDRVRFVPA